MSHVRTLSPDAALHPPTDGLLGTSAARETAVHGSWRETTLGRWLVRLRERDEMRGLSEHERRDAGITAYDVAFECRKPPWRD